MSEQKYITLENGYDVPAEDYIMAYAPLSLIKRICEPLGDDRSESVVSSQEGGSP